MAALLRKNSFDLKGFHFFIKRRQNVIFCLVHLFFFSSSIFSQEMFFYGSVIDSITGEPLVGASIFHNENPVMFGQTDLQGKYKIKAKLNSAVFTFSYIGYEVKDIQLKLNEPLQIKLSPSKLTLNELEIVHNRTVEKGVQSLSQILLTKELLSRNSSAGLGDVLAQVDGVTFISTGTNIQLPVIHGLYGNRILILNNGFKHGFQNWGSDHAPEIDVTGAENVKVIKGAAGIKYGPDALGGAVIIENNNLSTNNPFYSQVTSSYQTNGRGYGTNILLGEGKKRLSYHLGGNFNKVGDRRAPDYRLTNSGAVEYAAQAGLKYTHDKWSLKANYSLVNQNLAILRTAVGSSGPALIRNMEAIIPTFIRDFSYDINEPNQLIQHQMASATLNHYFNNGGQLSLRYARQWNARQEFDVRRNAELPVMDLELQTDDLQIEWQHSINDKVSGSFGVQYFSQSNNNNPGTLITPFIPNYTSSRYSIFILETLNKKKGSWEFGLRYDIEQNAVGGRDNRQVVFQDNFNFGNFTAGIGHINLINKSITWRNNIGSGWRPPNMADLYSFGQHEAQTTFGLLRYATNDNGTINASRVIPLNESAINPENSIKYNSELEWENAGNRLSVSAYANYIGNFIFTRPIGVLGTARGPMPTFIVDQADALFLGADINFSKAYHENGKATLGASYIWSRNIQRGETLINQPPIHLNFKLNHTFYKIAGFDKVELSVNPTYTFRQFQAPRAIGIRDLVEGNESVTINDPIFDFKAPPPGYFLLNAFAAIHKGKFSLSIEGRNLLNTSYRDYLNSMRYFADELGANFIFSLTYKL